MKMDISNFYFMTPLSQPGYIWIKTIDLPDKLTKEYNLKDKETKDGTIHIEGNKEMYGLPQSGFLDN